MERDDILQLIDRPAELRSLEDMRALAAAVATDGSLGRVEAALEGALSAYRGALDPEVPGDLLDRLATRLAQQARPRPAAAEVGLLDRLAAALRARWLWLPVAALGALALVLLTPPAADAPGDPSAGVRFKGAAAGQVGLSLAIQREGGGVEAARSGATLRPGDALIFRAPVRGEGRLILLERAPGGAVTAIAQREVSGGEQEIRLTAPSGQELAWTPDGPPGIWTYRAVLVPEAADPSPGAPAELWEQPGGAASAPISVELSPGRAR